MYTPSLLTHIMTILNVVGLPVLSTLLASAGTDWPGRDAKAVMLNGRRLAHLIPEEYREGMLNLIKELRTTGVMERAWS